MAMRRFGDSTGKEVVWRRPLARREVGGRRGGAGGDVGALATAKACRMGLYCT